MLCYICKETLFTVDLNNELVLINDFIVLIQSDNDLHNCIITYYKSAKK